jgi:polyisoprenyl-phosphate glycosyltransferase
VPTPLISVVTPVYGAACLEQLYRRVAAALPAISDNFEIVMVNDASPDQAWSLIEALAALDSRVRGLNLSRNVGQHEAILAGLEHARGEWVVVMDCDLQDQPEEIPRLYHAALESNFDVVLARRTLRQQTFHRALASKAFYALLSIVTGIVHDPAVANFGIYRRTVIEAIIATRERHFFPLLVRSVGFRQTSIDVTHAQRGAGASSYSVARMVRLAVTVLAANVAFRIRRRPSAPPRG